MIWVLRCERIIQEKPLSNGKIRARWLQAINERLTINKVTVTKIVRSDKFTKLVENTWVPALRKEGEPPARWMYHGEVLVGRTA